MDGESHNRVPPFYVPLQCLHIAAPRTQGPSLLCSHPIPKVTLFGSEVRKASCSQAHGRFGPSARRVNQRAH